MSIRVSPTKPGQVDVRTLIAITLERIPPRRWPTNPAKKGKVTRH